MTGSRRWRIDAIAKQVQIRRLPGKTKLCPTLAQQPTKACGDTLAPHTKELTATAILGDDVATEKMLELGKGDELLDKLAATEANRRADLAGARPIERKLWSCSINVPNCLTDSSSATQAGEARA